MHKLCEYLDDELKALERKAGNGKLSNSELEYGDLLAHFKKSLLTNEAMEGSDYSEEYRGDMSRGGRMNRRDGMSYDDGMSFARGRTGNVRRDSMGRYSNDGMSYGDAKEELMMSLHEYIKTAPEDEKQDARRFMNALKNM
jgi:hypothetical protein